MTEPLPTPPPLATGVHYLDWDGVCRAAMVIAHEENDLLTVQVFQLNSTYSNSGTAHDPDRQAPNTWHGIHDVPTG